MNLTDSMRNSKVWTVLVYAVCLISFWFLLSIYQSSTCETAGDSHSGTVMDRPVIVQESSRGWDVSSKSGKTYHYDANSPLIFIGGVPRSGTTLMRAMLDAHPGVRCGEETRIVPRILGMRAQWKRSEKEAKRLVEAGVTDDIIDTAVSNFVLEFIIRHGEPAEWLCNKDPFTLKSGEYLHKLFPNAKFVLMIRDGRAVVHSIITRKVTITGFDLKSYRQCMQKWNQAITAMYHQCYLLGESRCFPMYYEEMVLHPKEVLQSLLKWLGVPWNDTVLHHERTEKSTDQVIKPVNLDALTKWVGAFPQDVVQDMAQIAPMLQHLGYDPLANPPRYGSPDSAVLHNTKEVRGNMKDWDKKAEDFLKQADNKVGRAPPAQIPDNDQGIPVQKQAGNDDIAS